MKPGGFDPSFLVRFLVFLALPVLLASLYLFCIRPSALRWGATPQEIARSMPGDDLVPSPTFSATRAITIQGTPRQIWPWLAQMGFRRAGYYGYDLIENLGSPSGIRSSNTILPALQHPQPGDEMPISAAASMIFGDVQPGSYLVWRGRMTPSDGSLVWALYPIDQSHTRLVSRVRLHYHWRDSRLILDLFTEFADHVAVPKILQGIAARVRGDPVESLTAEAVEISVWLLALTECSIAGVLVLFGRHCVRAWLLSAAAGLVLLFTLYAHAPVGICAALALAVLGMMVALLRKRVPPYSARSASTGSIAAARRAGK